MPYATIDRPSNNFRIKLYTGNGSTQSITFDESNSMQPDFTWIKVRNDANVTLVHDVIRGATKEMYTSLTNAEATDANGLTAFNSNGFSVGSAFGVNRNTYNFVNWSWKANGAGVSNTAGSITSTVSANTTSGFSIVSYTGNGGNGTVGHGLGVAPKVVIIKTRSSSGSWVVGHDSMGWGFWIPLDATNAKISSATIFQNTAPTSTVFSENIFGTDQCIAYCFADVKGFSKFGSYTGNGSADGTFVYTGFKPAWVLMKVTSTTDGWLLMDNKRDTYNQVINQLEPNTSNAESANTARAMDFLSNGFKFRSNNTQNNQSGASYIYMAFAENPFVSSKGLPCTAR